MTELLVCANGGHPLYGRVKAGVFTQDPCYACERDWERAYFLATGRNRNMAPEGFLYRCGHKLECHYDRMGPNSSGYPYHVKGGTCNMPMSVHKVPSGDEWPVA